MTTTAKIVAVSAASIEPQPIEWLWRPWIPVGGITLLVGDPGLGKSLLSTHLVARLTRGELEGDAGSALMLTAEDSHAHTIVPRLEAANADLNRVWFGQIDHDGIERPIQLPNDVDRVAELVDQHKARLVVIDPLMAHLGANVDSWKDASVRRAIAPLRSLAEKSNTAVLLIGHLNKGQALDPLKRIGGSIGIPAACRSVLLMGRNPNDREGERGNERILAHVKSNLGHLNKSIKLAIEAANTDAGVETAVFRETGTSALTASQLVDTGTLNAESAIVAAEQFLIEQLEAGSVKSAEVQRRATEAGIAPATLARARRRLNIVATKNGFDDGWSLALPSDGEAVEGNVK